MSLMVNSKQCVDGSEPEQQDSEGVCKAACFRNRATVGAAPVSGGVVIDAAALLAHERVATP